MYIHTASSFFSIPPRTEVIAITSSDSHACNEHRSKSLQHASWMACLAWHRDRNQNSLCLGAFKCFDRLDFKSRIEQEETHRFQPLPQIQRYSREVQEHFPDAQKSGLHQSTGLLGSRRSFPRAEYTIDSAVERIVGTDCAGSARTCTTSSLRCTGGSSIEL